MLRRVRVAPAFDAQRTCERRTYEYLLPAAALLPDAAAVGEAEVVALRKRLRSLLKRFRGAHDFAHFTRSGAAYTCAHDTQRHIARVAAREAVRDEAGAAFVVLAISGASFLYHQVRSMVGAVVAVVRGARSEAWLGRVLLPPRRSRAEPRRVEAAIDKATIAAVPLAPANALYLAEVHHYSHDLRAAAEGERLRTLRADADGADAGAGGAALVADGRGGRRRRVPEARAHIMGVEAREGRMREVGRRARQRRLKCAVHLPRLYPRLPVTTTTVASSSSDPYPRSSGRRVGIRTTCWTAEPPQLDNSAPSENRRRGDPEGIRGDMGCGASTPVKPIARRPVGAGAANLQQRLGRGRKGEWQPARTAVGRAGGGVGGG